MACEISGQGEARADAVLVLSPWALAILLAGSFVVVFDVFVVNVAMPSLQADLHVGFGDAGLVIAVYALAFGSCLIVGGRLGDVHGRRGVFAVGMGGFALASLACGVAPTAPVLIVARAVQGGSAALLFPQVYAYLRLLPDIEARRRAFGALGMTLGMAAIAGQLLSGLLVWADLWGLGWRMVFFITLPVGGSAVMALHCLPDSRGGGRPDFDPVGMVLAVMALAMIVWPLMQVPQLGWPVWTWVCLCSAAALAGGFFCWENRYRRTGRMPLIDPALFGNRPFRVATMAVLLVYSTPASLFLCFSMTLQQDGALSALQTGGLLTPMSIGFILASLLASRLVSRWGWRAIAAGMGLYAAGFVWIAFAVDALARHAISPLIFCLGMGIFGVGQGLSGPPLLNIALGAVDRARAGMAGGVVSTVQQLGVAVGIICATVAFSRPQMSLPEVGQAFWGSTPFGGAMLWNASVMVAALWCLRSMSAGERQKPGIAVPEKTGASQTENCDGQGGDGR